MIDIGFLGLGKMGSALLQGILKNKVFDARAIAFYAPSPETKAKGKSLGLALATNEIALFDVARIIVLAIKPQKYDEVFALLKGLDFEGKTIVSLAPGKSIRSLKAVFPGARIVRAMPNTPALIGQGVTTIAFDGEPIPEILSVFASIGTYAVVEEKQIDEAIPLNGSMPAYLFSFVKAFVDCGVSHGFSEQQARELALRSVIGSCELALNSPLDFDGLISQVCSKGGSTLAGLEQLNEKGFIEAIEACYEACVSRSKELGDA